MLTELHVRGLGVISDVTVELGPGMTALTGETGAGKTLLVAALQLVLGGRASTGLVRAGAEHALVDARFEHDAGGVEQSAPGGHPAGEPCGDPAGETGEEAVGRPTGRPGEKPAEETAATDEAPVDVDGAETILSRAVPVTGRSRAWIDGRMVPVTALVEVGAELVDIHGQHDQQTLLGVAGQRAALDQFAHADLAPLQAARQTLADVHRRLAALGGDARERARRLDLLRYQVAEIAAAEIVDVDEEALLDTESQRLADMSALRSAAALAANALDADEAGGMPASSATGRAGDAVRALAGREPFAEWERRLRGALAELGDIAAELRHVAESWEDDPARLEAVQSRLRHLAELRRKYGDTLADVVAFADDAQREITLLEAQEHEAVELEARRAVAERAVADAEASLRKVRAEAAPALGAAVTERLHTLAMPDATLEVVVGEEGAGDSVTFLLAANKGEPAQPLHRVASGGELARTMLSLRLVVEGGAPTMLFDEVDAGVGGSAALALAQALHEVAATRQVLVVTHLPQVAAFADHQLAVRKVVDGERTSTSVEPLDTEGRIVELSRMLSGHPDSATARAHAEELLVAAHGAPASTTAVTARD